MVPQQADSNFVVPLGSDSNVGDALTNAGAGDGVVLQPVMSASEADASVVGNDGVQMSESKAPLQLVLKLETSVCWQTALSSTILTMVASKASLQLVLKLETAVCWQTIISLMMVASTLAVSELMVALLVEWLLAELVWLSDECVLIVCWSC